MNVSELIELLKTMESDKEVLFSNDPFSKKLRPVELVLINRSEGQEIVLCSRPPQYKAT